MHINTLEKNADKPSEQTLINKIVVEFMREQRRKRHWRWVYRSLFLLFILVALYQFISNSSAITSSHSKPHVGLIDLKGSISDTDNANSENFVKGLTAAYKSTGLKAIILRINSPGGSPVQADYMYNSLQYYRKLHPQVKIYAVCVDICASAAYFIAAGAQEIYANPSSLVGSIGVVYNGFGFVDTLHRLGVTRRLHTAGSNKGFLDPFLPENTYQLQALQTMLNTVHQQFIDKVKAGRGKRLKIDNDSFSGLLWTGESAKSRGLIDGFASSKELARDIIKISPIIDYTYKQPIFERLSTNIGTSIANQLPKAFGVKQGITE